MCHISQEIPFPTSNWDDSFSSSSSSSSLRLHTFRSRAACVKTVCPPVERDPVLLGYSSAAPGNRFRPISRSLVSPLNKLSRELQSLICSNDVSLLRTPGRNATTRSGGLQGGSASIVCLPYYISKMDYFYIHLALCVTFLSPYRQSPSHPNSLMSGRQTASQPVSRPARQADGREASRHPR